MTAQERAVIEAAKNLFGMRTIDTNTGEVWRHRSICSWMGAALFDAIVALEGSPVIDPSEIRPAGTPTPADLYRARRNEGMRP